MLKKSFAFILIIIMCTALFVGCDSKTNNNEAQPTTTTGTNNNESTKPTFPTEDNTISEEWKKFEVVINENTITLPCSYLDFKEMTGCTVSDIEENDGLKPGWYSLICPMDNNGKGFCYINVTNPLDKENVAKDGVIVSIEHDYILAEESEVKISFVGLHAGEEISKQDLLQMFGEPHDIKERRSEEESQKQWDNDTYLWYLNEENFECGFFKVTLNINTNLIEEIAMSNNPYAVS